MPIKPVVRVTARYLGGTRVQFTCAAGHTWQEDMSYPKGRRYPHIRLSEAAVAMLARYWERGPHQLTATCSACRKLHPTVQDRLQAARRQRRLRRPTPGSK